MKYFVVSDIHSFYAELIKALEEAGFDPNNEDHCFISCGDAMDRGPDAKKCLEFMMSLPRRILIRGNHDDLLAELMFKLRYPKLHDRTNGTLDTIYQLTGKDMKYEYNEAITELQNNDLLKSYLSELVNYAEIGKYIFTHACMPDDTLNYKEASEQDWYFARWENPFIKAYYESHSSVEELKKFYEEHVIVFGHWHTSWAHCYLENDGPEFSEGDEKCNCSPYFGKGIIGIDASTANNGKVNCVVLDI